MLTSNLFSLGGDCDVWVEGGSSRLQMASQDQLVAQFNRIWHEPQNGASYTMFINQIDQYPFLTESLHNGEKGDATIA